MRAGGHQAPERLGGHGQVATRGDERVDGRRDAGTRRRDDLQLRRGELQLEARIAADALDHLPRVRAQVERLGVEQEELLLDADAERVGRVEARPQRLGFHVAQPPWSRAAFGPPCHS